MERSIPRDWRVRKQRYSLLAEVCNTCEEYIFPPRDVCPHCAEQVKEQRELINPRQIWPINSSRMAPNVEEEGSGI